MGQEFFINNQVLEDKIRQLLPSQGGAGAGFDLSASTQIIPIIDVTESAEGSNLRQDLQSALSFVTATVFAVSGSTTTVITNTGYWRIIGTCSSISSAAGDAEGSIIINDGVSDKTVWTKRISATAAVLAGTSVSFDFILKLEAGDSLKVYTDGASTDIGGSVRQIADIDGNLTNP
jgi:hypothetical protein